MNLTCIRLASSSCHPGAKMELKKLLRIMKLIIILLTTVALQVSAKGYGQNVTLSLKDASLDRLFLEIRKQTGLNFSFTNTVAKDIKPISIDVKNTSVKELLDRVVKSNPTITYIIKDSVIVLKQNTTSEKQEDNNTILPPIDVKGRVVNDNNEPVTGA